MLECLGMSKLLSLAPLIDRLDGWMEEEEEGNDGRKK